MHEWVKIVLSYPPTPIAALAIVLKTAIVYLFLVVGFRIMGKRELGQMTIYDLVLIIVIANAVQNSMLGEDATLMGGIFSAATLLTMNRALTLIIAHSRKIEKFMVGEPVLIILNGARVEANCRKEGVTHEQIMAALREHGFETIAEVRLAVLEVDGTISIVHNSTRMHRTKHHFKALRI